MNFTSMDATNHNSIAYIIKSFLENAGNGLSKVFVKEVHTDKVCVGETCVTEDQLRTLLQNIPAQHNTSTSTASNDTSVESSDSLGSLEDQDNISENIDNSGNDIVSTESPE